MKIDAHQHFWNFDRQRDTWITDDMVRIQQDFSPADLQPLLQQHHFDGCVAVQADASQNETDFLLVLADEHAFIKGVVGWLDLCSDTIDDLLARYALNENFKGVRYILQGQPEGTMFRKDFQRGIAAMEPYGLAYDLLIYPNQLEEAIELVAAFPKQRFILDHCAKPHIKAKEIEIWQKQMVQLSKFENVACKVSGLITEADWDTWNRSTIEPYLEVVFDAFGSHRTLFGSDWPVSLLAGSYSKTVALVEDYISKFSETEQQQIMGLNAKNWYNLKD